MSKLNQINSLCHWLSLHTKYDCRVLYDSGEDYFSILVIKGDHPIFSHAISAFGKKSEKIIHFELSTIINNLLHIKSDYQEQEVKDGF